KRALVLEPAKDEDGKIKTARKGVGRFVIRAKGKPAHAGLDPTKGASAVAAMANVVQQLVPLTDLDKGTTVNPGVIKGGTRPNVIAAECELHVDVRVWTMDDAEELEEAIQAITPNVDGVTLEISGQIGPPLERTPRNRELWRRAEAIGQEMGVVFEESEVGGGSDGNTTSLYCPTLDGLGAVGDGAHAVHEFIYPEKLVERLTLLTMLLLSE
ncbi:MAG: M20/M25/M40 family metallo-hydrolase, partial [Chloroflexota bacterium]